LNRGMLGL